MRLICNRCGRPLTEEIIEARRLHKSQAVKDALAMAKRLGEPVGRPQEYDREIIVRLRSEGKSMREIARLVGCSLGTVQRSIRGAFE